MSLTPERRPATLWVVAPPTVAADADRLMALLDDLLALLRPYGIREVETSEPRRYRLTARGRALLRDALAAGHLESIQFDSFANSAAGFVLAMLDLGIGREWLPDVPMRLETRVTPGPDTRAEDLFLGFAGLVARWFGPLGAAAAFVSDRPGDHGVGTEHERGHRQPPLVTWPAVRRYVRGAFWGMALGAPLCDRLGGAARVLRDAPVAEARPLGDGVWLQLAASPPADPVAYDRLAAYLDPLLHWTKAELEALLPQAAPARPAVDGASRVRPGPPAVPVRFLKPLAGDVVINVHFANPPALAQRDAIERAVRAWYDEGFAGAFGGAGFHFLSAASADAPGRTLRWSADLGLADARRAIRALAERLRALDGAGVERLVIGVERAG